MSNKYIVKNCPSYSNGYIGCTAYRVSSCFCERCTDCLIKQVIEKCKKECDPTNDDWCRDKENLSREISFNL